MMFYCIQDDFGTVIDDDVLIPDPFSSPMPSSIPSSLSSDLEEELETASSNTSTAGDVSIEEPFSYGLYDYYDYDSDLLYESSKVTVIQSLAILFNWFSSFPGLSKEAFSNLLNILHFILLPKGNKLPNSYSKALTLIKHLLLSETEYDCCVNDCVVYRNCAKGDFSSLTTCPICNTDRYEPNTKLARKKYKYIPIGPRIRRMFSDASVSKLLQSHLSRAATEEVSDLHQSAEWISSYSKNGQFKGDPRGISLSLCLDGMNPYSKEKISYSMWPITLNVLNLPSEVRHHLGSMMLVGIIPGKSEPQDIDPYAEILIDEITSLNNSECYDAYHKEVFLLNIDILMTVVDYPGLNKVFNCVGKPGACYLH